MVKDLNTLVNNRHRSLLTVVQSEDMQQEAVEVGQSSASTRLERKQDLIRNSEGGHGCIHG